MWREAEECGVTDWPKNPWKNLTTDIGKSKVLA
jgi:hypothetical protein